MKAPKPAPPLSRADRGAKRALVLEEAAKALNHRGISQTSLAQIAQSVGVSRAALYYYFEDQEDLVFQSYRRSCEIMARRLNEATSKGPNPHAIIEAFVDGMVGQDEPEIAALSETAYLRPDQRATILGLYEAVMAQICHVLDTGVRRGDVRPCRSQVVAQAIVGLVSWIPLARRWNTNNPLSHQDLVAGIKATLDFGTATERTETLDYQPISLSSIEVPIDRVFDASALAAAKQEALLASASWLFNLKGVDATSLEEIALRIGVTKKVIYHNVGDKETLVVECYRRAFRLFQHVADRGKTYQGSRIEALSATAHATTEAHLREDISPLAPLAGFEALPTPVRAEINRAATKLMNTYLEIYRAGQKEGTVRPGISRALLAMRPAFFEWLPKWYGAPDPIERDEIAREIVQLARLGLKPL